MKQSTGCISSSHICWLFLRKWFGQGRRWFSRSKSSQFEKNKSSRCSCCVLSFTASCSSLSSTKPDVCLPLRSFLANANWNGKRTALFRFINLIGIHSNRYLISFLLSSFLSPFSSLFFPIFSAVFSLFLFHQCSHTQDFFHLKGIHFRRYLTSSILIRSFIYLLGNAQEYFFKIHKILQAHKLWSHIELLLKEILIIPNSKQVSLLISKAFLADIKFSSSARLCLFHISGEKFISKAITHKCHKS